MKIKMRCDNHDCFKKGDVFQVHGCPGDAHIQCNSVKDGGRHYLLDDDHGNIPFDKMHDTEEFEIIRED